MAMQQSQMTAFEITNMTEVLNHLSALDTRDKRVVSDIRKELRKPFFDAWLKRSFKVLFFESLLSFPT